MIENNHKLTFTTIVASLIAITQCLGFSEIPGFVTPAIAQNNHPAIDNPNQKTPFPTITNNKEQRDVFRCELGTDDIYRTIAYTRQGNTVGLITWKGTTNQDSGYSPRQRCTILANRFQRFSDAGQLKYVSTGIINQQPVICISSSGGQCQADGLLLTLDPKDNPEKTLKDLFDVSSRVSVGDANMGDNTVDITKLLLDNSP